jgi:hypothetical protein
MGRKIRPEDREEVGVETYSSLYGSVKATQIWLGVLFITFTVALIACYIAGSAKISAVCLFIFLILCSTPAIMFIRTQNGKYLQQLEKTAGIWTIGMYLSLGSIPMLIKLFL